MFGLRYHWLQPQGSLGQVNFIEGVVLVLIVQSVLTLIFAWDCLFKNVFKGPELLQTCAMCR